MSSNDVQVLIEHFDHKFDSLAEALSLTNSGVGSLAKDSDLQKVKQDVQAIKAAVTATNRDVRRLEVRVTRLETKI
ncbi:MAG TPA: hypothetical protein VK712_00425 [Verrucomicrobiae bacterium]|jgi:hypothetical protein|nr:hypothetical protein [Verrucomicrobiae bacterium]